MDKRRSGNIGDGRINDADGILDKDYILKIADLSSQFIGMESYNNFKCLISVYNEKELKQLCRNERFLLSFLKYKIHMEEYADVCNMLKNLKGARSPLFLQLWDEAVCKNEVKKKGGTLTPVRRHRIRQKFPPPAGLCCGGTRPVERISRSARAQLRSWFDSHIRHPYPSRSVKQRLASEAGVTLHQVTTWFANTRRRNKVRHQKSKSMLSLEYKTRQNGTACQTTTGTRADTATDKDLNEDIGYHVNEASVSELEVKLVDLAGIQHIPVECTPYITSGTEYIGNTGANILEGSACHSQNEGFKFSYYPEGITYSANEVSATQSTDVPHGIETSTNMTEFEIQHQKSQQIKDLTIGQPEIGLLDAALSEFKILDINVGAAAARQLSSYGDGSLYEEPVDLQEPIDLSVKDPREHACKTDALSLQVNYPPSFSLSANQGVGETICGCHRNDYMSPVPRSGTGMYDTLVCLSLEDESVGETRTEQEVCYHGDHNIHDWQYGVHHTYVNYSTVASSYMSRQTGVSLNPSTLQPVLATSADTQYLDCLQGMTQIIDGLGVREDPSQKVQTDSRTVVGEAIEGLLNLGSQHIGYETKTFHTIPT